MSILMKHLALAVGFMTMGSAVVSAQQAPALPTSAAASTNVLIGPKIQFATPLYDFGRARAGELVKYTYVFTNTGDQLLILKTVQGQCHCTTAGQWTKQVEPGKTGSIPIQFDSTANNGPVFKQVTVTCNVTNQPTLFLQLKGTVYRPYAVNPQIAVLNLAPDAEGASMIVTITNNTEEPLLLSSPEVNNRAFSVQLVTNQLGRGYQAKVSIVPPMPTVNVQGQMILKTSWTNTPNIRVALVANVQPAVMVTPPHINLAPGPLPRAVTNSVTIQNNSATNVLKLSEPTINVPGVEVEIRENQPGKSFSPMLAFPQGFQVPPGQPVELSFKTSNPRFPVVKVPVRQMLRPHAAILPAPRPPTVAPSSTFPLGPAVMPVEPGGRLPSAGGSSPPPG